MLTRSQALACITTPARLSLAAWGLSLIVGIASCTLTPASVTALEAADAAACAASTLIPVVGPVLADVCVGEEGAVRAALDHALAAQDAGPQTVSVGASMAALAAAPLVPVYRRHGTRLVRSRVPAPLAAACQAHLDAHPAAEDGGAALLAPPPDAAAWHPDVVAAAPLDAGTDGPTLAGLEQVLAAQQAEVQRLGVIVEAHAGARATRARDAGAEGGRP